MKNERRWKLCIIYGKVFRRIDVRLVVRVKVHEWSGIVRVAVNVWESHLWYLLALNCNIKCDTFLETRMMLGFSIMNFEFRS